MNVSLEKTVEFLGGSFEKNQQILQKSNLLPSEKARNLINLWKLCDISSIEKVHLYSVIKSSAMYPENVKIHLLFEIREQLLKECFLNRSVGVLAELAVRINLPDLSKAMLEAAEKKDILCNISNKVNDTWKSFIIEKSEKNRKTDSLAPDKFRSLFVTLEYEGSEVGGIAAVTKSLSKAMINKGHDIRVLTPFYDTLVSQYPNAKFVTSFEHYYQGKWVVSTLYKVMSQNGCVKQYLLKPQHEYMNSVEIGEPSNVYNSHLEECSAYLSSAAAAFGSLYNGKKTEKQFDIIHTHSGYLTLCTRLLNEVFLPKRKEVSLPPIGTVGHIHGTGYHEQGLWMSPKIYTDLGFETPSFRNLELEGNRHANVNIHVSQTTASLAQTRAKGYGLQDIASINAKQGRLFGIQNGIETQSFDPTNKALLGRYTFEQSLNKKVDFIGGRKKIKEALHQAKILPSSDKPLFVFIGRYTLIKGVDVLPSMVEKIIEQGGQCVIMGESQGEMLSDAVVKKLKAIEKKHPGGLKVFTKMEEQKALFTDTQIPVKSLIRAATDYGLVPSHREAGGIIPKEMWAAGAICVTSNVEGIADQGKGLGAIDREQRAYDLQSFNAFTYDDKNNYLTASQNAIIQALNFHRTTTEQQRNEIANRIHAEAMNNYGWDTSITEMETAYKRAIVPLNNNEIQERQKVYNNYIRSAGSFFKRIQRMMDRFFNGVVWNHIKARILFSFSNLNKKISNLFTTTIG